MPAPKRASHRARPTPHHSARPAAGSSRKKTGCYTCRIRRKRCDEGRESPDGGCNTCYRLRLECLGYGDKRPTWLREREALDETLEKIKKHLTKNGLLRGQHTHAAARHSHEGVTGNILILNPRPHGAREDDEDADSSPAPSSPSAVSISSDDNIHHMTSSLRDEPQQQHQPEFTMTSSYATEPVPGADPIMYFTSDNPTELMPAFTWGPVVAPSFEPGLPSRFGESYNMPDSAFSPEEVYEDGPSWPNMQYLAHQQTFAQQAPQMLVHHQQPFLGDGWFFRTFDTPELQQYLHCVAKKQFLLADERVIGVIHSALASGGPAYQAAALLTQLHEHTARGQHAPLQFARQYVDELGSQIIPHTSVTDHRNALAALQLVSCLLHVGGRGPWEHYLDYAVDWVLASFQQSPYPAAVHFGQQPADAQFVMRTAIWFDVLGAITRAQPPRLRTVFQSLQHARITGADEDEDGSMMSLMGCEDGIVLALGETSELARWAENQRARGALSTVELVSRGQEIESRLLTKPATPQPPPPPHSVAARRALTSDVFRASARLYLHTVLSGEAPACREIRDAVEETVNALRRVQPDGGDAERSIVRMTVFASCLAGCMTDEPAYRAELAQRLERQHAQRAGGNCAEVLRVMRAVWDARRCGEPLGWREAVAQSPEGLLLLV